MIRDLQKFEKLLGWRQGACPVTITPENLNDSAIRKYEEFAALITTENLWYVFPNYDKAKTTTENETAFNEWLADLVTSGVNQSFNYIFKQVNDLVYNYLLYPYEFDFNNPIANDVDFVGFEIEIIKDKRYTNVINQIQATFDAAGTVKVLLFDSSKKAPLQSIDITVEENNTVVQEVEWFLPYTTGRYYIGYLRNGLVPKALDRRFELSNLPQQYKYAYWTEVRVPGHDSEEMFDMNLVQNESKTWGLNFDISVHKDWTDIGVNNKKKFTDMIGMGVGINGLDAIINSTRSNEKERVTRAQAILALEGNQDPKLGLISQGLKERYFTEVDAVRKLFITDEQIARRTMKF